MERSCLASLGVLGQYQSQSPFPGTMLPHEEKECSGVGASTLQGEKEATEDTSGKRGLNMSSGVVGGAGELELCNCCCDDARMTLALYLSLAKMLASAKVFGVAAF